MKTTTKLIVIHPFAHKQVVSHRKWLLIILSFFTFAFALTLISTTRDLISTTAAASAATAFPLPKPVFDALLHYAAKPNSPTSTKMSTAELRSVTAVLRRCPTPCNFLIFGLTHETPSGISSTTMAEPSSSTKTPTPSAKSKRKAPNLKPKTSNSLPKVSHLHDLLHHARGKIRNECRPVQKLLFSDCKLGINDRPNYVYEMGWDVILVDEPNGNFPAAPRRMAAIFTAGNILYPILINHSQFRYNY